MIGTNDLWEFHRRHVLAEQRWQQRILRLVFVMIFVAGFILGWGLAKW